MVANPQDPRMTGESGVDELRAAREQLSHEFSEAITAAKRCFYVERQALGLALFDSAFHVASVAIGTLVGLALALTAAVLVVTGARHGLRILSDGAWWSDLVVALGVLGIVVIGAHTYRRWVHRTVMKKTRLMLEKTATVAGAPKGDGAKVRAS